MQTISATQGDHIGLLATMCQAVNVHLQLKQCYKEKYA